MYYNDTFTSLHYTKGKSDLAAVTHYCPMAYSTVKISFLKRDHGKISYEHSVYESDDDKTLS